MKDKEAKAVLWLTPHLLHWPRRKRPAAANARKGGRHT